MEDEKSIRLQAGCAILFLFDLIALCILLYLALGAGLLVPADCTIERQAVCDVARDEQGNILAVAFWATVMANASFVIWALWRRSR